MFYCFRYRQSKMEPSTESVEFILIGAGKQIVRTGYPIPPCPYPSPYSLLQGCPALAPCPPTPPWRSSSLVTATTWSRLACARQAGMLPSSPELWRERLLTMTGKSLLLPRVWVLLWTTPCPSSGLTWSGYTQVQRWEVEQMVVWTLNVFIYGGQMMLSVLISLS